MGTGRVARHGKSARGGARSRFRHFATRLFVRFSSCGRRLLARLPTLWLARFVCRRRTARPARHLYPGARSRIRRLAAATERNARKIVRLVADDFAKLATLDLRRAVDDGV